MRKTLIWTMNELGYTLVTSTFNNLYLRFEKPYLNEWRKEKHLYYVIRNKIFYTFGSQYLKGFSDPIIEPPVEKMKLKNISLAN
jgi:hypothetical protein